MWWFGHLKYFFKCFKINISYTVTKCWAVWSQSNRPHVYRSVCLDAWKVNPKRYERLNTLFRLLDMARKSRWQVLLRASLILLFVYTFMNWVAQKSLVILSVINKKLQKCLSLEFTHKARYDLSFFCECSTDHCDYRLCNWCYFSLTHTSALRPIQSPGHKCRWTKETKCVSARESLTLSRTLIG